jgi:hypothetical protein
MTGKPLKKMDVEKYLSSSYQGINCKFLNFFHGLTKLKLKNKSAGILFET